MASVPDACVPWGVNEWARGGEIECRAKVRSGGENEATRVRMTIGRTARPLKVQGLDIVVEGGAHLNRHLKMSEGE